VLATLPTVLSLTSSKVEARMDPHNLHYAAQEVSVAPGSETYWPSFRNCCSWRRCALGETLPDADGWLAGCVSLHCAGPARYIDSPGVGPSMTLAAR